MAQVTKEIKGTGAARNSLLGNDIRIRRFHVNGATEGNDWTPQDALDASLIPKVGDAHPDRPELLCHDVTADPVDGAYKLAFVEAVYAIPRGTILGLPPSWYRVRWTMSTGTKFETVGIDGQPIGSPYVFPMTEDEQKKYVQLAEPNGVRNAMDPHAELGTNVFTTEMWCEVILPVPSQFDADGAFSFMRGVNAENYTIGAHTFLPGWVQLLNVNADEVGPQPGDYAVTLNYRVGTTILDFGKDQDGNPDTVTIDLAHTYHFLSETKDFETKNNVLHIKEKAVIQPRKRPELVQVYPYKKLPILPPRG